MQLSGATNALSLGQGCLQAGDLLGKRFQIGFDLREVQVQSFHPFERHAPRGGIELAAQLFLARQSLPPISVSPDALPFRLVA
jgi:hypothetical protein